MNFISLPWLTIDAPTSISESTSDAMIATERVKAEFTPKIENAETEAERTELAQEADVAAIAAVDATVGITASEYLGIIRAAQEDEDLAGRINARIKELSEK